MVRMTRSWYSCPLSYVNPLMPSKSNCCHSPGWSSVMTSIHSIPSSKNGGYIMPVSEETVMEISFVMSFASSSLQLVVRSAPIKRRIGRSSFFMIDGF